MDFFYPAVYFGVVCYRTGGGRKHELIKTREMERERERVKMAPAGNQHREDRRVGWWMDGLAGDERNETGYGRTAVYSSSLSFLPSLFRLYTSPINFSLSLSLSTT